MIQAQGLSKSYGALQVLKSIDVTISKGEIVSIVGPSGAGKTTLLQLLGTLDSPDTGKVIINNTDVFALNAKELAAMRNKWIGFVFQFHHLLPEFTALENVCIPALIAGTPKAAAENRAKELLDFLKLDHRLHHKPEAMSGGEQQRTAVARALINNPLVVMADEPTGNLDSNNAIDMHNLFFELRKELGQTFVIVTHNDALADQTDYKLMMKDGSIVEKVMRKEA